MSVGIMKLGSKIDVHSNMTAPHSESGLAFVTVIIFLLALSWIGAEMMMQSLLVYEMAKKSELQSEANRIQEKQLHAEEAKLMKRIMEGSTDIPLGVFLPDHLELGCHQGVFIYKVTAPPLQSFIVWPK